MGRRKIEIKFIEDGRKRAITLGKRKKGIQKKAHELSVLTGCKVTLQIEDGDGSQSTFAPDKLDNKPVDEKPVPEEQDIDIKTPSTPTGRTEDIDNADGGSLELELSSVMDITSPAPQDQAMIPYAGHSEFHTSMWHYMNQPVSGDCGLAQFPIETPFQWENPPPFNLLMPSTSYPPSNLEGMELQLNPYSYGQYGHGLTWPYTTSFIPYI
jgi:hypothetical protein